MTQKLIYVPASFPEEPYAEYLFVGEAPGAEEEVTRKPFSGRAGRFLKETLESLGISSSEIILTNAVKVRPLDNRAPSLEEIESWTPELLRDVEDAIDLNSSIKIIALGKTAAKALNYMAKDDFYELPHPSYALRFGKTFEWKEKLKEIINSADKY